MHELLTRVRLAAMRACAISALHCLGSAGTGAGRFRRMARAGGRGKPASQIGVLIRGAAALILLLLCLAASGCSSPRDAVESGVDPETHRAEIDEWHQGRLEKLTAEDSWLSLVGLFWLTEGANRFGTDPENEVVFADSPALAGLPGTIGTLTLATRSDDPRVPETVRLDVEAGVPLTVDGEEATSAALRWDQEGEASIVRLGSLTFYVIERGGEVGVRIKDSESPVRREFAGLDRYPVSADWRFVGRFAPYDPPRTIPFPNVIGRDLEQMSPGAVVFEIDGEEYRLHAIADSADEELFVIVGDRTNGHRTYGGGRYIYLDPPDANGTVVVDFNKLYNPPCAFTPYATCSLPPGQNRMPFEIEAGEFAYGGSEH